MTLPKIATGRLVTVNIGTTVSSLVRISLADALCREAGARSDCCTNMDKWLKRVNPPSRETPSASTSRPTIEDAPAGDSNPGCSYESLDQGASSSTFVASQATSMVTDSESDAELRPPDMRKHTDRETTSSKRRKYDENYIALGFTCTVLVHLLGQCVICAKVLSQLDETFTFAQTFGNQPFSLEK